MKASSRCGLAAVRSSVILIGIIVYCSGCTEPPQPVRDVVRPVKTMVVTAGNDTRTRVFSGTVDASKRVELAFQVPGLLTSFPVKEGKEVAKGELIGQLRQDEFQARLDSLRGQLDQARSTLTALCAGERREEQLRREAQVREARARLVNAKAELDRNTPLVRNRVITRTEFDAIETQYQVARENYESALQLLEKGTIGREEDIMGQEAVVRGLEAQVVEADIRLRDTVLTAPYDGVIARRFVEEGQNVQAKQPVVRFQDIDEVEIVVDVPETVMAAEIQASNIVAIVAELSGAPGVEFPLRIREVAQVADPTTQTFQVARRCRLPKGSAPSPG